MENHVNLLQPSVAFLCTLQRSGNYFFSDAFKGYKKTTLGKNGLKKVCLKKLWKIMLTHQCPILPFYNSLKPSE